MDRWVPAFAGKSGVTRRDHPNPSSENHELIDRAGG
jgi:hypothetical protein